MTTFPFPCVLCLHLRVACKHFRCTGAERKRFGHSSKVTSDPSSPPAYEDSSKMASGCPKMGPRWSQVTLEPSKHSPKMASRPLKKLIKPV